MNTTYIWGLTPTLSVTINGTTSESKIKTLNPSNSTFAILLKNGHVIKMVWNRMFFQKPILKTKMSDGYKTVRT